MEVRQLGLPATVDQSKYDTNIKAWPDGMPPTNPRSPNRFAILSQKQHTANIQRNRWLFFFYGARCCAAVQGITSSRVDSAATGPLKARTS
jgi:hypothetical protein